MTLSEVSTLLPPPEGMEWRERPREPKDYMLVVVSTGVQAGYLFTDAPLSDANDHPCVVSMTVADRHYREIVAHPDLPSAYLRALTAVGLAPDAEKEALRGEVGSLRDALKVTEGVVGSAYRQVQALCADVADLRRRLTWTSEVPTEPGVYVVGRGVKPYDGSIMFRRWDEDGGKMERPWVDAFGLPWTDEQMKGRRFFALDNLKETP